MALINPYRLPTEELSHMTDDELQDYILELEVKIAASKGYGRKQYKRELTRAKKMLRTTKE